MSVAAWWLLHEDAETKIRRAHEELNLLLNKEEGQASSAPIFNARTLRDMFADACSVTGDAEVFTGIYTPEDMVGTIIQVQALFQRIELTFSELEVEFSAADDARVRFSAVLAAQRSAGAQVDEVRDVISRMRKVDGNWLFAEFNLVELSGQ